MSSLNLKPSVKRALLQQSLRTEFSVGRNPKCFSRFLLLNKEFFGMAKSEQIYRLFIDIKESGTCFFFGDFGTQGYKVNASRCIFLNLEKASRFVRFLNPGFIDIFFGNLDLTYVSLLNLFDGKIGLHFHKEFDFAPGLIAAYWARLFALECSMVKFKSVQTLPPKNFDQLIVIGVSSMSDMTEVLRHGAKRLWLSLNEEFSVVDEVSVKEVGEIHNCTINIPMYLPANKVSCVIQTLNIACKFLECLAVEVTCHISYAEELGVSELVEEIDIAHTKYKQLIEELSKIAVNAQARVRMQIFGKDFALPHNWMAKSLVNEEFKSVHFSTTLVDGEVLSMLSDEQVKENVYGAFWVDVKYRFASPEDLKPSWSKFVTGFKSMFVSSES